MTSKRAYAALARKIEKMRERIGKERDALRELIDEAEDILESVGQAEEALQTAVDFLSQYA